jgi:GTPase involved in cell partitioning and DNA repair
LIKNYLKVREELHKYDKTLSKKHEIIVFNKSDLLEKKEIEKKLKLFKTKIKKKIEIISVFTDKKLIDIRKILLKNVHKQS